MDELTPINEPMARMDAQAKNPLALAFIGDTVWDLLVRRRLLGSNARVNALHKEATSRVNAGAQARALEAILPMLTEDEAAIVRRGSNAHCKHLAPRNQDPVDYRHATGLEALIGYLWLTGDYGRIRRLFDAVP